MKTTNKMSALFAGIVGVAGFMCGMAVADAAVSITSVTQTPWIISDNGTLKSETSLSLNNTGVQFNAWTRITVAGKPAYMESIGGLAGGISSKTVHVVELRNDGDNVTFQIFDNAEGTGAALASTTIAQKKIRHWKIYVAHSHHTDIGFTDPQESLMFKIWPSHIDSAFSYIEKAGTASANDKFRYPAEQSFSISSALAVRNADWEQTLRRNLASGAMSYGAGFVNMDYESMGPEELVRNYYATQRLLKDRLGYGSSGVLMQCDVPSLSWPMVDIMADIGLKYMFIASNPDSSKWAYHAYPMLFYSQGRIAGNRILVLNGPLYNKDEMNFCPDGPRHTAVPLASTIKDIAHSIMTTYQSTEYPVDAILQWVTQYWDNGPLLPEVNQRVREVTARKDASGRTYVYPQLITSTVGDFFSYVDAHFSSDIPSFKGTIENWWNFGAGSVAYETGIGKLNHDKIPAAETFSTFANSGIANAGYPVEDIYAAYKNQLLFDEHTFGNMFGSFDIQAVWKRNTAIAASQTGDRVLENALSAISTALPAVGTTLAVFNPNSWSRSDIVAVKLATLPAFFDIVDLETEKAVPFQKMNDEVLFCANKVPGLGYKCFRVNTRQNEPVFPSTVTATSNTLENVFFKITFDETGAIVSIIDKMNGNKEMVDATAPYRMNQFIYYTTKVGSFTVQTTNPITNATLSSSVGPVCGTFTANGSPATGATDMLRVVTLHDSLPRIDIVNTFIKTVAPDHNLQNEEGFFVFPLNVSNFMLRHEMPSGDVRPFISTNINNAANEQLYSSSTDHYTVNRWIDASNQEDYGITFAPINVPLVQYGERRSFSFLLTYNTAKPWIYSYVLNNKWHCNCLKSQPGPIVCRYSLRSHNSGDWKSGRADKFGMETTIGLKATVISGTQTGGGLSGTTGRFIAIDKDNVVLTTAKLAEANGEGILLRFNETLGQTTDVTVDVRYFNPISVTETDLVENDRTPIPVTGGKVAFTIPGHGWKTLRLTKGTAPAAVTGVSAVMDAKGTQVAWTNAGDNAIAFYEVFRDTSAGFAPGAGSYLGTVSVNHFYDVQVMTGLTRNYYYKVRAARAGLKGPFSSAAQATAGTITDNTPPSAPVAKLEYSIPTRVAINWTPSVDNVAVMGYKVYRNGVEIATLSDAMNSYLDAAEGSGFTYSVKAFDQGGRLSGASNSITTAAKPGIL